MKVHTALRGVAGFERLLARFRGGGPFTSASPAFLLLISSVCGIRTQAHMHTHSRMLFASKFPNAIDAGGHFESYVFREGNDLGEEVKITYTELYVEVFLLLANT